MLSGDVDADPSQLYQPGLGDYATLEPIPASKLGQSGSRRLWFLTAQPLGAGGAAAGLPQAAWRPRHVSQQCAVTSVGHTRPSFFLTGSFLSLPEKADEMQPARPPGVSRAQPPRAGAKRSDLPPRGTINPSQAVGRDFPLQERLIWVERAL